MKQVGLMAKGGPKISPELENAFQLFLPGISDCRDKKAVLLALQDDPHWKVLFLALLKGGRIKMDPKSRKKGELIHWHLDVPVRSVEWTQLYVQVVEKAGVLGLLIQLPADLTLLHAAWLAFLTQKPYDWHEFTLQYRAKIDESVGEMLVRVQSSRIDGLQMPADSDPRLAPKTVDGKTRYYVGLTQKTMKRFVKEYGRKYPELVVHWNLHGTLAGAMLLLVRFPTVYVKSGLWCELVELDDREDGKIYHDAKTWKELQDGDDDGDLAYLGMDQYGVKYVEPSHVPGPYPELVLGRSELLLDRLLEIRGNPTTVEDDLFALRNARLKCLTGTITYVMKCLGYSYAHIAAVDKQTPHDCMLAKVKAFTEVYSVTSILISAALDMKKVDGAVDGVARFAQACQFAIQGGPLNIEPFRQFLPEDKHPGMYDRLVRIVNATAITTNGEVERSLRSARRSAYGQYVVSQNHLLRSGHFIVDRMVGAGVPRERVWDAFIWDAMGEEVLTLPLPEPPNPRPNKTPIKLETGEILGDELQRIQSMLAGITWNGAPVFKIENARLFDDGVVLKLEFRPGWKEWLKYPISVKALRLPRIARLKGSEWGHMLVKLGVHERLFMPIFRPGNDGPVTVDVWTYLQEAIVATLKTFNGRDAVDDMRIAIQHAITDAVSRLVEATPQELLVRRFEAMVMVGEHRTAQSVEGQKSTGRDFMIEEELRANLLRQLAESGWDIMTTSKNDPGTIVTRNGKRGVPGYILCVNPFELFDMKKRRNEKRELRMALELAHPEPPKVRIAGQAALPPEFARCITNLRVGVGDLVGINYWLEDGGWGYDTLVCCPSAVKKLALRGMTLVVKSEAERDRVLQELEEDGLETRVRWRSEKTDNGFTLGRWVIDVTGPVEDAGKIKACVGPLKGIMTVIPVQLFDAHGQAIDLVVPFDTLVRKKGCSVTLHLLYQLLGISEVDPELPLETHVAFLQAALNEKFGTEDPREMVHAEHTDGSGRAYPVGLMLTGELPFYRPVQTVRDTVRWKSGDRGIKMQPHATLLSRDEAGNALTWRYAGKCRRAFNSLLKVREEMHGQCKDLLAAGEPAASVERSHA